MIETKCENCGQIFEATSPRAKYCSTSCKQQAYRSRQEGEVSGGNGSHDDSDLDWWEREDGLDNENAPSESVPEYQMGLREEERNSEECYGENEAGHSNGVTVTGENSQERYGENEAGHSNGVTVTGENSEERYGENEAGKSGKNTESDASPAESYGKGGSEHCNDLTVTDRNPAIGYRNDGPPPFNNVTVTGGNSGPSSQGNGGHSGTGNSQTHFQDNDAGRQDKINNPARQSGKSYVTGSGNNKGNSRRIELNKKKIRRRYPEHYYASNGMLKAHAVGRMHRLDRLALKFKPSNFTDEEWYEYTPEIDGRPLDIYLEAKEQFDQERKDFAIREMNIRIRYWFKRLGIMAKKDSVRVESLKSILTSMQAFVASERFKRIHSDHPHRIELLAETDHLAHFLKKTPVPRNQWVQFKPSYGFQLRALRVISDINECLNF